MFKVGQKVIILEKTTPCGEKYPHYGEMATVKEVNDLGYVRVSIDGFNNCNHPEMHNRFWHRPDLLETVEVEMLP